MPYTPPTPYIAGSGNVNYSTGLQFVDEVLTNVAKQYRPQGFLYDQIVAPQQVEFNIGKYPVFDPAYFFSLGGRLNVADDAPTPIVDIQWSKDVYQCQDYRLQTRLTRKELNQAHPVLKLDYSKTLELLTIFASNREYRLAQKLAPTTNVDSLLNIQGQFTNTGSTPSVKWDQGTTGSPASIQKDLQAAALVVYKQCGIWPNTLVIDKPVALAIASDPTIQTMIQYLIGTRILAEGGGAGSSGGKGILPDTLFGFKILVADGTLYNSARPGQAASLNGTWGNNARLIYTDPAAQWGKPATVYSFRGRVTGSSAQPPQAVMPSGDGGQEPGPTAAWAIVERWYDMDPPAEHIRAWECVDERVVAPETGILIPTVLNSY